MPGATVTVAPDWEADDTQAPKGLEIWFRGKTQLTRRTRRLVTIALVLAFVATTATSFILTLTHWNAMPSYVTGEGLNQTYTFHRRTSAAIDAEKNQTSWIAEVGVVISLLTLIGFTFRAAITHGRTYERYRSERFLGRLFEQVPDGLALFDKESRLVTCNRQYVDYYPEDMRDLIKPGIARSTLFKELSKVGLPIPAGADAELALMTTDQQGMRSSVSRDIRMRDGSWFRMRYVPTAEGGFCAIISDVSDYKQREEKLAEHERGFRRLIEESVQGIVVIQNWRPVYANQAYAEIFGYSSPSEILSLTSIRQMVSDPREFRDLENALSNPNAGLMRSQLEFKGVRKDGTIVWLDNRMSLINWYGKIAVLSAVFDITEQKLAHDRVIESKDQAVAASRAKSEFLANMSHELRTPLNAIIGFSEVLRDELFGPLGQERYKDYATDIHSSGVHLLGVINDILDVAKAEAGKLELSEEVVRVEDIVSGVLRLIRERASNNDVSLIVTVPDNLPDLRCDPLKLKQVLINLLSNAVKFTLPHGDVILSAGIMESGEFYFEIRDTGIGMAKESIPLAMQAFTQVDSSLDRKYEGTGLGLPLVKMLTDIHGGQFDLDSELGVGTTARIRLPAYRMMNSSSSSPYTTTVPQLPDRIHDVA